MSVALAPGLIHHPGHLDGPARGRLAAEVAAALAAAPPFTPRMPRTGKPFSVRMSNAGPLGWVSDAGGYRYQRVHPETGAPWPAIPPTALAAWAALAGFPAPPEACLINLYAPGARMGLHQDRDEDDLAAPVLSLSLGAPALFRYGGLRRSDPTRSVRLEPGDALVIGGASRLIHHGIDRLYAAGDPLDGGPLAGASLDGDLPDGDLPDGDLPDGDLPDGGRAPAFLPPGGRCNLTLRRVSGPGP